MNDSMDPQFEAWARKMGMDLEWRNIPGVGKFYECPRTLLALDAWKAGRAVVAENDMGAAISSPENPS